MPLPHPWATSWIAMRPCGLRECALRVEYMSLSVVRQCAEKGKKGTLFSRVARWRTEDPESFAQLLAAMKEKT